MSTTIKTNQRKGVSVNFKKKYEELLKEKNKLQKENDFFSRNVLSINLNSFQIEYLKAIIMKDFLKVKQMMNSGFLDEKLSKEDKTYLDHYREKIKLIISIQNKLNLND